MSAQLDLQLLKAEENALLKIYGKLTEQLNRLKVEELALLSQIRKNADAQDEQLFSSNEKESGIHNIPTSQEISPGPSNSAMTSSQNETINNVPLNLDPRANKMNGEEEEEEEEDDSMDHDQLTALVKQFDK